MIKFAPSLAHLRLAHFPEPLTFRADLPVMTTTLSRLPLLFIASALLLSPLAAKASPPQSLYDPSTAQKLTPQQEALLGPESKHFRYDKRMLHALTIAQERAHQHSTSRCWHFVKTALMAANAVDSYPKTAYAKEAGDELVKSYGFKKVRVSDPYKAPLGSVIVYGGKGAGHVEIRTASGFVSDFSSIKPSSRPLIGVYVKPKA